MSGTESPARPRPTARLRSRRRRNGPMLQSSFHSTRSTVCRLACSSATRPGVTGSASDGRIELRAPPGYPERSLAVRVTAPNRPREAIIAQDRAQAAAAANAAVGALLPPVAALPGTVMHAHCSRTPSLLQRRRACFRQPRPRGRRLQSRWPRSKIACVTAPVTSRFPSGRLVTARAGSVLATGWGGGVGVGGAGCGPRTGGCGGCGPHARQGSLHGGSALLGRGAGRAGCVHPPFPPRMSRARALTVSCALAQWWLPFRGRGGASSSWCAAKSRTCACS